MKIKNFQKDKNSISENKINWLVGIILGDGRVSERYVRIYNNDRNIIQMCKDIFQYNLKIPKNKFKTRMLSKNRNGYKRNAETIELGINSTVFAKEFKNLTSKQLNNPKPYFMRGLFDAEGSVDLAGNIILWQRKDELGTTVSESIERFLKTYKIKYRIINNEDFYIFEILGRYKHYQNLTKFSEIVGFSSKQKLKDLNLIINIFSKRTFVKNQEIIKFVSKNKEVTLRDVIEKFEITKINGYTMLKKLVDENKIKKIKSYPNIYKIC
ncbi:MAG: hypothetical protein KKB03_00965 [Nanoarchaeota archaeon]|nr:hypothetical protein [Nanoarchaeota archaeon]MBU2519798.1 hypothetical protein [Nanoarchaeota archaeon]